MTAADVSWSRARLRSQRGSSPPCDVRGRDREDGAILEERSHHISAGIEYLPAVARRLHHGRDLGEPFDFLTWFEFAPSDATAFEDLVQRLRAMEEWSYVDREVDIRLTWDAGN